jgi:para-nitrobenzyl esterase
VPGALKSASELLVGLLIRDNLARDRHSAKHLIERMSPAAIREYFYTKSYADFAAVSDGISAAHPAMQVRYPQLFEDGVVLPEKPIMQVLAEGDYCRIPMILGTTRDEYSILLPIAVGTGSGLLSATPRGFKINDRLRYQLLTEYLSALFQSDCVDEPAERMFTHQPDSLYAYRFDWDELDPTPWLDDVRLGATHGIEVAFVFGHRDIGAEYIQLKLINPARLDSYEQLSAHVMQYWAQFARTGNPNSAGSSRWMHWSPATREKFILDTPDRAGLRMVTSPAIKPEILQRLHNDARFTDADSRAVFFNELRDIRAVFRLALEGNTPFS